MPTDDTEPLALELVAGELDLGGSRLTDLNLSLQAGQTGALLGTTGAGKTSLLRAIAGLAPLQAGRLSNNGMCLCDATGMEVPAHRRQLSLAPQDLQLMTDRTVQDNVALGLKSDQLPQRLELCLEVLGLAELRRARPHQLSGGQQRLVALARALAPAPGLVLLDEPTSGLDRQLKERVPALVRQLLPEQTAILMSTHDFDEAFAWADRIGVLANGRLENWQDTRDLWQHPPSVVVARALGLGQLLKARLRPLPQGAVHISTAAGDVTLQDCPVEGTDAWLLVRAGGLTVARSDTGIRARVLRFRVRGGRAGTDVQLQGSDEVCWIACSAGQRPAAKGDLLSIALDANLTHLLPLD